MNELLKILSAVALAGLCALIWRSAYEEFAPWRWSWWPWKH